MTASDGLAVIEHTADGFDAPVIDLAAVYGEAPPEAPAHEPLPAAEAWETFEPLLWAYALAKIRQDIPEAIYPLEEAVREGRRPAPEDVRDAWQALLAAEELVEEYYAPLAGADDVDE